MRSPRASSRSSLLSGLVLCALVPRAPLLARAAPTAPLVDRRVSRAVVFAVDGLGWGHAEEAALGERFTRAGSIPSPNLDTAGVHSR